MAISDDCKVTIKNAASEVTWDPFLLKKSLFTSSTDTGTTLTAN